MAQAIKSKEPKTGGDDLDDGLELDPGLLASDDESGSEGDQGDALDGGDDIEGVSGDRFVLDDEDEGEGSGEASGSGEMNAARKRKAGEAEMDEEAAKAEKRKRKREKDKERKAKRQQNTSLSTAKSIPSTLLTPDQFSSLLLASIRETYPSATAMEIDDIVLPIDRLLAASQFTPPDNDDGTKGMQKRIEGIVKSGKGDYLKENGMPRVIVLCLSGLRCADVVRLVRDVRGKGEVAKLFAKHMKVPEQVKYLAATKVSIAVGTPARIAKLISEDALKLTKSTVLLLDIGHRDSKTRTLLTMPEARTELWKSVLSGEVRRKLLDAGVHIGPV